jgi:hypothetical protein
MLKTENQKPFYNVMPEIHANKTHPPTLVPKRSVDASAADKVFGTSVTPASPVTSNFKLGESSKLSGFFKRKSIVIPSAIILLTVAGLGGWLFLRSKGEVTPEPEIIPQNTETEIQLDTTTPGDWLERFFGAATCTAKTQCGDLADPDRDGLNNKEEYELGTDPNNPDGDSDGLADGDERYIFNSDPLLSKTYREGEYSDADFVKGSYDFKTNQPYTPEQLSDMKDRVKERGLHQPTLSTIGTLALTIYDFEDPSVKTLQEMNIDVSPQAKLDRDTQRQSTIKKVGGALLKYKNAKNSYPMTSDFIEMSDAISPFNTVATNYNDPINKDQYVYGYEGAATGADFTLTYYSETQNQLIKYTAKNAEAAAEKENAQTKDDQRISDLENIKSALMIYSSANSDSNSELINVFPTKEQYPSVLIPRYITSVPKDPDGQAYAYEVSAAYDTFTLKAILKNPPAGSTGYMCNQEECRYY